MIEFIALFLTWCNFDKLKIGIKYFMIVFGVLFLLKVWCDFFI